MTFLSQSFILSEELKAAQFLTLTLIWRPLNILGFSLLTKARDKAHSQPISRFEKVGLKVATTARPPENEASTSVETGYSWGKPINRHMAPRHRTPSERRLQCLQHDHTLNRPNGTGSRGGRAAQKMHELCLAHLGLGGTSPIFIRTPPEWPRDTAKSRQTQH